MGGSSESDHMIGKLNSIGPGVYFTSRRAVKKASQHFKACCGSRHPRLDSFFWVAGFNMNLDMRRRSRRFARRLDLRVQAPLTSTTTTQ